MAGIIYLTDPNGGAVILPSAGAGKILTDNGANPPSFQSFSGTATLTPNYQTNITGTTVTLPYTPSQMVGVYKNGIELAIGTDVTLSGSVLTFTTALSSDNIFTMGLVGGVLSGTAGGDLSGTYPNPTVSQINNLSLATTGYGLTGNHPSEAVSLTSTSAFLGSSLGIVTGSYTDGPAIAQGSSGKWFVIGFATFINSTTVDDPSVKLWDGTTVIAGAVCANSSGAGFPTTICLAGIISSPTGNIRLSAQSNSGTSNTQFRFNTSGTSKDCGVYGARIG